MEEIFMTEKKVLVHDEKSYQDTLQLIEGLSKDDLSHVAKVIENDPKAKEVYELTHLDKGRTVWLELTVNDSYLSHLIYTWMFSRSKFDGGSGLQAMGCTLNTLMYNHPLPKGEGF